VSFPNGTTEHPINKSGKNKILVSVWDFGAVHPQSERSQYLCSDHPAKMRPPLARAILQLYGESPVLDPMAGIGTTLVEAMLLGMDAVGVEYEQKFVDKANENINHIMKAFPNKGLGKVKCLKGDARDLSFLRIQKFGSIVFSPPYLEESIVRRGKLKENKMRAKVSCSPYGYSADPRNISTIKNYDEYLGEMLKVCKECYRVLKSGKFMVVVVKDLRRKGLTVPVGADMVKLCQSVGFQVYEIIVNRVHHADFWSLYHAKRYLTRGEPKALKNHEYVLVFRKPS